jgi:8-oxo-dGTP pyrophosphatase MutT (NUDIX family)
MDELWELPPEIRSYLQEKQLPIQLYSSPVDSAFEGLKPQAGIVTVVIKNDDDEILFIRHSEEDRFWELPSGHIKDEEGPEESVRREVKEETGYSLSSVAPVVAIIWPFDDTMRVQIVFNARLGEKVSDDTDNEAEELSWRNEIPEDVTFGDFGHEMYEYYLDNWEDQEDTESYRKHGLVVTLGLGLTLAAVKGVRKLRETEEDTEY